MPYDGPKSPAQLRLELEARCKDLGFTRVRVASVDGGSPGIDGYDRFLANGYHGDMSWMVRSRPPRANVKELMPDAKSIMVLGIDYWHPRPEKPKGLYGRVSRYAWGRDYHNLIGKRLGKLCRTLRTHHSGLQVYFGVDSRPFIERAWANRSGVGYVGKNTMIISPSQGSYFFLAMLLLNVDLPPDTPLKKDFCGRCERCLNQCPTNAFVRPYQMDARRCISYWTIEKKGAIPVDSRQLMGDWIFGCDDCQEVCPHNHHPYLSTEKDLSPRPANAWLDIKWLLTAADSSIIKHFEGSPIKRPGVRRLRRNALVVLGNSGDKSAIPLIERFLHDPDQMLRNHANWAMENCRGLIMK